jgi:hypothetical protein
MKGVQPMTKRCSHGSQHIWHLCQAAGLCLLLLSLLAPLPSVQAQSPGKSAREAPAKSASEALATTPIVGFADLHTHHMGHLMFDGEWLVGQPSGPQATALAACT